MAINMQTIRDTIFKSPSGTIDSKRLHIPTDLFPKSCLSDIEELATDAGAYGMIGLHAFLLWILTYICPSKGHMRVLVIS